MSKSLLESDGSESYSPRLVCLFGYSSFTTWWLFVSIIYLFLLFVSIIYLFLVFICF